jgi:hypothetical protein
VYVDSRAGETTHTTFSPARALAEALAQHKKTMRAACESCDFSYKNGVKGAPERRQWASRAVWGGCERARERGGERERVRVLTCIVEVSAREAKGEGDGHGRILLRGAETHVCQQHFSYRVYSFGLPMAGRAWWGICTPENPAHTALESASSHTFYSIAALIVRLGLPSHCSVTTPACPYLYAAGEAAATASAASSAPSAHLKMVAAACGCSRRRNGPERPPTFPAT